MRRLAIGLLLATLPNAYVLPGQQQNQPTDWRDAVGPERLTLEAWRPARRGLVRDGGWNGVGGDVFGRHGGLLRYVRSVFWKRPPVGAALVDQAFPALWEAFKLLSVS